MTDIPVKAEKSYNILIENGLIDRCGPEIRKVSEAKRALVISDDTVAPIYGDRVLSSLTSSGFTARIHTFPAGERSKNLATIGGLLDALCKFGISRSDLVVALGGGVCGDMAGFAAAVYLRGIDFVQIPTTLLAQIDSSVGGKTGCDLPAGKNLAGAFHNPLLVLIDPATLSTLPDRIFRDGMAEAVKYGCIKSEALFRDIETRSLPEFLPELIRICVEMKRDVVEADFRESGERMLLNFGHTLGHALERYYHFETFTHGEAVGIGMVMITGAAENRGLCKPGTSSQIASCLQKLGLPVSADVSAEDLLRFTGNDKKRRGGKLNLVLLREIGQSFIYPIDEMQLYEFLTEDAE